MILQKYNLLTQVSGSMVPDARNFVQFTGITEAAREGGTQSLYRRRLIKCDRILIVLFTIMLGKIDGTHSKNWSWRQICRKTIADLYQCRRGKSNKLHNEQLLCFNGILLLFLLNNKLHLLPNHEREHN